MVGHPKEVLLKAEIRLPGKTIRIGTKGLKKGFDFLLNFPLARSVRQAYQKWALLSAFHLPHPRITEKYVLGDTPVARGLKKRSAEQTTRCLAGSSQKRGCTKLVLAFRSVNGTSVPCPILGNNIQG
jgi:hypothetical protein